MSPRDSFCSHRQLGPGESWFTKLSDFSLIESSREEWHENQTSPCFSSLGKASESEPGLGNEVSQASWSLLSFWCENQVAFFMVKNPGFEAGLPGFVTPLCYFLAVWSQASYSASLSLGFPTCKMGIISISAHCPEGLSRILYILSA